MEYVGTIIQLANKNRDPDIRLRFFTERKWTSWTVIEARRRIIEKMGNFMILLGNEVARQAVRIAKAFFIR